MAALKRQASSDHRLFASPLAAQLTDAVDSIPSFITACSEMWVLTPPVVHCDDTDACCDSLAQLPGVKAHAADAVIDATFTGEVDRIIKTLAEYSVQSIESVGGELDEVLLDFYSDERYAPKVGG